MWASTSWYFHQKAIQSFFHPSRHKLQSLSFSPFLRESYWKQGLWKSTVLGWVQNEAGQRLTEFWQEKAPVIANTLFQQHKRRLYTCTSPDGQYGNQIDYILCRTASLDSILGGLDLLLLGNHNKVQFLTPIRELKRGYKKYNE